MSVKSTVKQILSEYPIDMFPISGAYIIDSVKSRMSIDNRKPFDGTIMRKLRELRNDSYIIECIDKHKSLYRIRRKNECN